MCTHLPDLRAKWFGGVCHGMARGPPDLLGMRHGGRGEGLSDVRESRRKRFWLEQLPNI